MIVLVSSVLWLLGILYSVTRPDFADLEPVDVAMWFIVGVPLTIVLYVIMIPGAVILVAPQAFNKTFEHYIKKSIK